jgi:hemerythrin superfamily protein
MAQPMPPRLEPLDAISRLTTDHEAMKELFAQYMGATSLPQKKELIDRLCTDLVVHMALEEEIFYPAAEAVLDGSSLMLEARAEHAAIKALITKIQETDAAQQQIDDRVRLLAELVSSHVDEEQRLLFPKVRAKNLDLSALGERLAQRQEELLSVGSPG